MKKSHFYFLFAALTTFTISCAHTERTPAQSSYLSFANEPSIRVKVTHKKVTSVAAQGKRSGKNRHGRKNSHGYRIAYVREVIEIPLENYLAGVIGHEMSPRWPREALKAQAIAARSYALYQMEWARRRGRDYDVVDSQADQVFKESGMANSNLQDIVNETRGLVIWKKGQIVQAFYSSTCGGQSETAVGAGFSKESPLAYSKSDNFCLASPFATWTESYSTTEISKRLDRAGFHVNELRDLCINKKNPSGYVELLQYKDTQGEHTLTGRDFRRLAGNMRIKSLLFDVRHEDDGSYVFTGHGFGHGVGMCQYGAKEMAEKGMNYRKILAKYYFKTQIKKLY